MSTITKSVQFNVGDRTFTAVLNSFDNAIALFVYEEIPHLGVLSISTPGTSIMPASTLYVTGTKDNHFVKLVGERLATKLQKLTLISLGLKEITNEIILEIIKAIEEAFFEKN